MKSWEGHLVGYGTDFKTFRIWESGKKIVPSRNETIIKTLPIEQSVFNPQNIDGGGNDLLTVGSSLS